jgi:hypothetical protein
MVARPVGSNDSTYQLPMNRTRTVVEQQPIAAAAGGRNLPRSRAFWRGRAVMLSVALLVGCSDDPTSPAAEPILNARVEANPYNALALNVIFTASGAPQARVRYRPVGGAAEATPYGPVVDGERMIPVLGLLPDTDYEIVIEAVSDQGEHFTEPMIGRTESVPDDVLAITLQSTEGTLADRLLLTAVGDYMVVFDGSGQVVWYRWMDAGAHVVDATGVGTFVVYVGETRGWDPTFGYFREIGPAGDLLRRHVANAPLYTDNHEILMTVDPDGGVSTHFFSYDLRRVDMSPYGGGAAANVAGHQLLRFGPDGGLEFLWNGWDHFEIDEWEVAVPPPASCVSLCDFDHPNSLDFDGEGNYVASFRSLNQVVSIEPRTGSVLWRLGGQNSDFTFVDDPLNGFSGQHTARIVDGRVLLFDNGPNHAPRHSRAVEYELSPGDSTATLVWSYEPSPLIYAPFQSSVQRLEDGNTLVAFSQGGHVHEVAADGTVVWKGNVRVDGVPYGFYRVVAITSLHDPQRVAPGP